MSCGKLAVEGWSAAVTGHVMVTLPEGHTLPVMMSAILFPPSSPGCHAMMTASARSRHDTVSITEPELMITITGLPA